jgi:hypothetical protein
MEDSNPFRCAKGREGDLSRCYDGRIGPSRESSESIVGMTGYLVGEA